MRFVFTKIIACADVRFGYVAALSRYSSSAAAFGREAEVKNPGNHDFEGPEPAKTGQSPIRNAIVVAVNPLPIVHGEWLLVPP